MKRLISNILHLFKKSPLKILSWKFFITQIMTSAMIIYNESRSNKNKTFTLLMRREFPKAYK